MVGARAALCREYDLVEADGTETAALSLFQRDPIDPRAACDEEPDTDHKSALAAELIDKCASRQTDAPELFRVGHLHERLS
ncbi:hypothetical protein A5906_13830 [Bradyrhizobium sacchari]|nr:hypothetical protein A5906_13830 [Bradyrhizobium sacchari]